MPTIAVRSNLLTTLALGTLYCFRRQSPTPLPLLPTLAVNVSPATIPTKSPPLLLPFPLPLPMSFASRLSPHPNAVCCRTTSAVSSAAAFLPPMFPVTATSAYCDIGFPNAVGYKTLTEADAKAAKRLQNPPKPATVVMQATAMTVVPVAVVMPSAVLGDGSDSEYVDAHFF